MEEFLIPMEVSSYRLAKEIGILQIYLSEINKDRRRITADTALRLSKYFVNSPKFWFGLQDKSDIEEEEGQLIAEELKAINKIVV